MTFLHKILNFLFWPYRKVSMHIRYKRQLKKLREQDPFIYH